MIKITISNNNIQERKYILDIIFNEFLGLKYEVECKKEKIKCDWEIELENGSKLIVEDHFFNQFPNDLEYLKLDNIPPQVEFLKNEFTPEEDIPVIYGNSKLNIENSTIICGIDIFASSFFMLTRWEEYVNKNRDSHNRFPAYESLASKQDFLDRPIVNEYLEMLKNMILHVSQNSKFKIQNFKLILTHDVDHIYKWDTIKKFIRHLGGDLIVRKSIKEFFKSLEYYVQVKLKLKNDPYDTFDYLMDASDKIGTKSYFFFMSKGLTKFDNNYNTNSEKVQKLHSKIKNRGHFIGIHPTYNAYNNYGQLKNEKEELENFFNTQILFGREHYLRFEIPTTWQVWEDNNMRWDSTCGYADKEGFRCGVCYEYNVFNILTRKKLRLKEKPLIAMEVSIVKQENMMPENMKNIIEKLILKVKKYNGEFVLLWHNSNFKFTEYRNYEHIYQEILDER